MKTLIIETTPATPHAETALEIGKKESLLGSEVIYSPIFHLLPQLFWKSNINGNNEGKEDSLVDWIRYLVNITKEFSHVDFPDALDFKNLSSFEEIQRDPLNFIHDGQPLGKLVSSAVIEIYKETNLNLINNDKLFIDLALTAAFSYEISMRLINKHNPNKVVFFNGRTIETYPIYLAAKKLKTDMLIHERGPTKNHFSIWTAPLHYVKNYADELKKFSKGRNFDRAKLSAAIFFERQKNAKLSTFNYISAIQNHDHEINLSDLNRKYIVFFTSSNWELDLIPGQDLSNGLGNQYEVVEKLSDICKNESIQLVIRLHPNSPVSEVNKFNLISQKNKCLVISPNDSLSSYILGKKAFRNFSYASTISWEFMHSHVNCAILSKSIGTDFKGVVELNNAASIIEYIRQDLAPIDNSFSIMLGDFLHNYGERYDYYKPNTLFSGIFNLTLDRAT